MLKCVLAIQWTDNATLRQSRMEFAAALKERLPGMWRIARRYLSYLEGSSPPADESLQWTVIFSEGDSRPGWALGLEVWGHPRLHETVDLQAVMTRQLGMFLQDYPALKELGLMKTPRSDAFAEAVDRLLVITQIPMAVAEVRRC